LMEYIASIKNLLPNYWYQIKVLNAKRFGALQSRSRSIVILIRKDIMKNHSLFPTKEPIDLSKQGVDAVLPHVVEFSAGQFKAKFKPAQGRIFCTLTAHSSQLVKEANMKIRKVSVEECKALTGMTGYDFTGICQTGQYMLLGNMVMRQMTRRLFENFKQFL